MDRDKKILIAVFTVAILAIVAISVAVSMITGGDSPDSWLFILMTVIFIPLMAAGVYMATTGKGSMMVAGYNTMAKSSRDYYDSEKIAKVTGRMTILITAMVYLGFAALFLIDGHYGLWIMIILMVVAIVIVLLYFSASGKFLKDPNVKPPAPTPEEKRKQKIITAVILTVVAVVMVVIFLFSMGGTVNAEMEDDGLKVSAPMVDKYVDYSDITDVELRDDLDLGSRSSGFAGFSISSGKFYNSEFGSYTLASYNSVKTYIVVHYSDSVLVFNQDSIDATSAFYDALKSKQMSTSGLISEGRLVNHVAIF